MKIDMEIKKMMKQINEMPEHMVAQAGQKALDFIGDYPLYAATSNITYTEAIMIALVLGKEI